MRYASSDGLMSSADPNAVALWEDIGARMENDKATWTERLRAMGVKLAHPDDGWVDRKRNRFSWSWYPQFDDRPEVGDLVAFGCPPGRSYGVDHYVPHGDHKRRWRGDFSLSADDLPEAACQGYRICRVTEVERRASILGYMQSLKYEDTGLRVPSIPPRRRWWQRAKS